MGDPGYRAVPRAAGMLREYLWADGWHDRVWRRADQHQAALRRAARRSWRRAWRVRNQRAQRGGLLSGVLR